MTWRALLINVGPVDWRGDESQRGGQRVRPAAAAQAERAGVQLRRQDQTDGRHGRAVQVDPIKPTLKAPVSKSLKLKYDKPVSNVAFKFNLRHYTMAVRHGGDSPGPAAYCDAAAAAAAAAAAKVGCCKSIPVLNLKAPGFSA